MWTTFLERRSDVLTALIEHIELSFVALFFAVVIAIPLSIYLTRHEKIAEPIINTTAVMQTIPSLALLGLMIPLFGIGRLPAVIALVVYALLPIMRNTYTGIKEVDSSLIEAADGLGMNRFKRLVKIELPLAMPVIMAGIRTAMVLIVGTTTLAALIGAGGLGDLILLGIDRNNTYLILLGAIPAALLAILFDGVLRLIGKLSYRKSFIAFSLIFISVLIVIMLPFIQKDTQEKIVIGGKLGSEPEILINLYKHLIEDKLDVDVELKPGLGKTSFVFNALKSGDIDLYPEFTGTVISQILDEEVVDKQKDKVYEQAKKGLENKFGLTYLKPMAYNNTYVLAMKKELALEKSISSISDLDQYKEELTAGFTLEFSDREDGYLGIKSLYGIEFTSIVTMEPKLRYSALDEGAIDILDAYSTDSELEKYDMTTLTDDLTLFPPYQGAPLINSKIIEKYPEIVDVLNVLDGKITDEEMRKMNYLVNIDGVPASKVAKDYLLDTGLLQ